MEHYYASNSKTELNKKQIVHTIAGKTFKFSTANAVFSKDSIDFGSHFLIDTILAEGRLAGKLLDVGCGYGAIGITLAYFNENLEVTMVDVNQRALDLASENINNYNLGQRVIAKESDACDNVEDSYQYIVTNPPIRAGKQVVQKIYKQSYTRLVMGGAIYVVIQKKQGAPSSKKYLENLYGNCEIIKKKAGYYILKSIKTAE